MRETVAGVIADIRERGDKAVSEYSEKFGKWSLDSFRLSDEEVGKTVGFARHRLDSLREFEVETLPGVPLGQEHIPVRAAGAYLPGVRCPLTASAHHLHRRPHPHRA
ncbi:histidinol dehydrogenase [Streptomyces sp. NPDC051636]|uniref:histidinol dehydrogenase n=1 Tax=Streptomyces sp. NPDC051636 TaxID=3365663 RepID=UPI0037B4EC1E